MYSWTDANFKILQDDIKISISVTVFVSRKVHTPEECSSDSFDIYFHFVTSYQ
jgi:hypothetical protein